MSAPDPAAYPWPALPLNEWRETYATLHMWTQVIGKVRLALSPYVNHWWHSTLYVSARGLSTSAIPYGPGVFEIEFDFRDHALRIATSQGETRTLPLAPRPVSAFYHEVMDALESLGIRIHIWPVPVEVPDPIPFEKDQLHASYNPEYAHRFWRVLMSVDKVFKQFRGGFIGKCSPVHFFWGSFDLAVTRFSGRPAPERPGADAITREAYSHEVISAGFWPGGGAIPDAAFYCYAAPEPPGFRESAVRPETAFYSAEMSEFFLMYDDVRKADAPEARLLEFLETTYQAGAALGNWDRQTLERATS